MSSCNDSSGSLDSSSLNQKKVYLQKQSAVFHIQKNGDTCILNQENALKTINTKKGLKLYQSQHARIQIQERPVSPIESLKKVSTCKDSSLRNKPFPALAGGALLVWNIVCSADGWASAYLTVRGRKVDFLRDENGGLSLVRNLAAGSILATLGAVCAKSLLGVPGLLSGLITGGTSGILQQIIDWTRANVSSDANVAVNVSHED